MTEFRPQSLQARLVWSLLGAILIAAAIQVALSYRNALAETDTVLDYYMQQTAASLRGGPRLDEPAAAELASNDRDVDLFVQIWTADGVRIFRSDPRVSVPPPDVLGFENIPARRTTFRVYSLRAPGYVIQVAQDLSARREIAGGMALRSLGPIALMAPVLMLVTGWVVRRSLAPVARVRQQVAGRQPSDLADVSEADLPEEIRPLIRELNLLMKRVRGALEAQQNFVADAAHELRSPLAALKLQLEGVERADEEGPRKIAIDRLRAGIDRSTRLVEQLLVLARQESQLTSGGRPERLLLDDVARGVLVELSPFAHSRGIDAGIAHADRAPMNGYPAALQVLVRNLLENAIKYTPVGGFVDVEVRRRDALVVLTVDDSGPGIPAAQRDRVLDRFHRGETADAGGSGLGLAIVKAIADLHGAQLTLEDSERRGGLRVAVSFAATD